jgi:hypothetical protein
MGKIIITAFVATAMLTAFGAFAGNKACCAKGAANAHSTACVNLASPESYAPSKDEDRGVASRMHEGRMHEGKPSDISESR